MRITIMAKVACCALLIPVPAFAEFKRIKSESEFRELLTDKRLENGEAWLLLQQDGKSIGEVEKQPWVGAWIWSDGAQCSNGRIGRNPETGTICHYWEVDGKTARKLSDLGKGDVMVYAIGE
jgi:hypothetical protein